MDEYLGFSVGRPEDWRIDYTEGTVWLWPEDETQISAFVYPIRPQEDGSAEQFVSSYVNALAAGFAAMDGTLEVTDGGTLQGSVGETTVEGEIAIEEVGPDLVIWGGWAPAERWESFRDTVMEIGSCYDRRPSRYLMVGRVEGPGTIGTTIWEYALPVPPEERLDDWIVVMAGSEGIHLAGDWNPELEGRNANVYRAVWPGLDRLFSIYTTEELAQFEAERRLGFENWELVNWRDQSPVFESTDEFGQTQSQAFSFEGRFGESQTIGTMQVAVTHTMGGVMGFVWLRQALHTEWDRLAAITQTIVTNTHTAGVGPVMEGFDLDFTDELMDSYAYREAVRDEAAAQWHETMMGFEPLVDPETGQEYWAPLNAYDPTSHCDSGFHLEDLRCLVHQRESG